MANVTEIFPTNKGTVDVSLNIADKETSIRVFGSDIIIESKGETFIILYGAVFVSLGNSLTIKDSTNARFSLSELLYSAKTEYELVDDKIDESDKVDNIVVKSNVEIKEGDKEGVFEVKYSQIEVEQIIKDTIEEAKNFKEDIEANKENLVTAKNLEEINNEVSSNVIDKNTTAQEVDFTERYKDPPVEENINSFDQTQDSLIQELGSLIPEFSLDTASDSGVIGDDRTNNANPTISGNFVKDSTIQLSVTKGITTTNYTVQTGTDGTWQQELALVDNDGVYTISATYTDNTATAHTYSDNITLDTTVSSPTLNLTIATDSGTKGDSKTNDTVPTINGSAEAGATISIALGSTVIGTTQANDDGVWQFSIPSSNALSSGSNSVNITATDVSGNISSATTIDIIIDNTPPDIPIVLTIGFDGDTTSPVELNKGIHILKGTAEANSIIELSIDDTLIGTRAVSSDGNWTFDLDTNPLDGDVAISIIARDDADNVSSAYTDTISIVGTINPPSISLSSASDTGFRSNETMVEIPTYEGITEANATVRLFRDNSQTSFTEVIADNQGVWSYTETSNLVEGGHTISAIATSGNSISNASILNFSIDLSPPTGLTINNASTVVNVFSSVDSIEITGTGTTPGNHFYYQILDSSANIISTTKDDGEIRIIETDGTWAFSIEPSIFSDNNGNYSVIVVEIDGAGNEVEISTAPSLALNVNLITFTIQSPSNDNTPDFAIEGPDNVAIVVSITDTNNQVVYTLNDTKTLAEAYTFSLNSALTDGDYTITVNTTDNTTNQTRDFTDSFTIDTIAPNSATNIAIASGSLGITADLAIDSNPEITGTAEANSIISLVVDGNTYTTTASSSGVWSITISNTLANGNHSAIIAISDVAGNSSIAQTYDFSVQVHSVADLVKDNISLLNADNTVFPNYTNDPAFSGTGASANTTIIAMLNNSDVGNTTVASDGSWSITIDSSVTDGQRDIQLIARDEYGNTSNTLDFPIVVDRVPPTKPTFGINGDVISGTVSNDDSAAFAVIEVVDTTGSTESFISLVGSSGNWLFTHSGLSNGDVISVQIQDRAGNLSEASNSETISGLSSDSGIELKEFDTTANLAITSQDYGIDNNYDFTATLEDASSSLSISSISLNGTMFSINNDGIVKNDDQVSFDLGEALGQAPNELQNGNYEITLIARDSIGNTTNYIHNVEILAENTSGAISLLGDNDNIDGNFVSSTTPIISGTDAIGENIIILNTSNNKSITTNIDSSGNWYAQVQSIVSENTQTTLNIMSSGYGNENVSSAFTLTYDDPAIT